MVAGRNRTATTALLVSIPIVITLSVLLLIAVYLFKSKRNRKPRKPVQIASASKCLNNTMILRISVETAYRNKLEYDWLFDVFLNKKIQKI